MGGTDLARGGVGARGVAAGDGDACAHRGQPERGRLADAAGATGDEDGAAGHGVLHYEVRGYVARVSASAWSKGVAWTPSLVAILLLSTMNGSSYWYCISRSSRTVGVEESDAAEHQRRHGAHLRSRSTGVPVDDVDELTGGAGVGVVGQVPHLAGSVGMFTEDGETLTDVGDVAVGVRLVEVAEDAGGLAGQRGGEHAVTQVRLGAATGAEVVRGAADGDLDPSVLVGREELAGHPSAQLALLGVGVVRAVLGERSSGGPPVHVDVLHADQAGAGGLGGRQHPGLQGGELRGPLGVGRVERLVDDAGTAGSCGGEARIAGVTTDDLDVVGNGSVAGTVHEPDALPAASERLVRRKADRPGPEDDVLRGVMPSPRSGCARTACRQLVVVGKQDVEQEAGQCGEGQRTVGTEDGELLLDMDLAEGGDGPAQRPQRGHRGGPQPAPAGTAAAGPGPGRDRGRDR